MPERLDEINTPIGTLDELKDINANPFKKRACHPRTKTADGTILGCPHFRACRFKPWRDQMARADGTTLKGPLNLGVEIALAEIDGGAVGQMEMACYQYYSNNTRARQKQQEETGELIRIVAYEGDGKMITERCTKWVPDGMGGQKMEPYESVHLVTPHKRPKERFAMAAAVNEARQFLHMDDVERAALANVLEREGVNNPRVVEPDAPMPIVGEGKKVGSGNKKD